MYATSEEQRRHGAKALAEKLYRTRRTYLLRIAVQNGVGDADAEEAVQRPFSPSSAISTPSAERRRWRG